MNTAESAVLQYSSPLAVQDELKSEVCSDSGDLQLLDCVDQTYFPQQQFYPDPYQEYVFNHYEQDPGRVFHPADYHHLHAESRPGVDEFRLVPETQEYFDLQQLERSDVPYPVEGCSSSENFHVDPASLLTHQRHDVPPENHYPTATADNICTASSGVCSNSCTICGRYYARTSTLKTHLRVHSGERPYACLQCLKRFSQAANLTAHMRIHSGEKPFLCPICHRKFSQSSSVTTHMRTHSGERPYLCNLCKKSFSDSSTLTKHFRTHSGERPYQCRICFMRFSQSGNLNRHMKIHGQKGA
ncbi:protein glass-like [Galendromus occidentalis]|uniref:Protein glass-like n=1 Tax=Galendromus occidentalis TaxID=34638 RepID=A0AAJ6QWS0_9ACAR|nr:protein glass-like [Galendromus occidentalis]